MRLHPYEKYIPGYSSAELKKEAIRLTFKTDSLERELYMSNQYLGSIKKVLTGDIKTNEINKDSLWEQYRNDPNILDLAPSREDSLLREEVALEDKYNLFTRQQLGQEFYFFLLYQVQFLMNTILKLNIML